MFDTAGDTSGWVVTNMYQYQFRNAHSTCTWSGHKELSNEREQKPLLHTMWLPTSQASNEDYWQSTSVGFDPFSETPPSEEEIIKLKSSDNPVILNQHSCNKKLIIERTVIG